METNGFGPGLFGVNLFENLCLLCLKNHILYENEVSEVWSLKDVPTDIKKKLNLKKNDYGIVVFIKLF